MEEAISFRSMTESLSPQEFTTFSNTLFNTFNQRELLTKSIFHLLAYQNRNALNTKYTQNINKILINIIHARNNNDDDYDDDDDEDDEDDDIDENKTFISDVAYPLIAECSSYLNSFEVIKFQSCNRHIYISCKKNAKSMTTLGTTMNGYNHHQWFSKYINNNFGSIQSRIKHLIQYNMVKQLNLSTSNAELITNHNNNQEQFVWKNIIKFNIGNFAMNPPGSWLKCIINILKSQQHLEHLIFAAYNVTDVLSLLSLISINEHIKFLTLNSMQMIHIAPENQLTQYEAIETFDFVNNMKNLRGIDMNDMLFPDDAVFFNVFLSKLFVQLQSYHVTACGVYGRHLPANYRSIWNQFGTNYKLNNLKEICIYVSKQIVNHDCCEVLTSLLANDTLNKSKLERLHLSFSCHTRDALFNMNEQTKFIEFIQHIFETQKTLKYLSISGDDGMVLAAICNYIADKLENNNNNSIFQSIKFRFINWRVLRENDNIRENIENQLFRLIHLMNEAVSGDFLIRCSLPWRKKGFFDRDDFDETNYFQCSRRLENLKDNYNVDKTESMKKGFGHDSITYIVTNKKANFHGGYHEQWLMNCAQCEE